MNIWDNTPNTPLNPNNLTSLYKIFLVQIMRPNLYSFVLNFFFFLLFADVLQRFQYGYSSQDLQAWGLTPQWLMSRDKRTLSCFSGSLQTVTCFCPGNISLDNIINLGHLLFPLYAIPLSEWKRSKISRNKHNKGYRNKKRHKLKATRHQITWK